MRETRLVDVIGWASVGVALVAFVAPSTLGRALGIGDRRKLARSLGARDLVVGLGMVRARNRRSWVRARLACDAGDAILLAAGGLSGHFPRAHALATAASAAALAAVDYSILKDMRGSGAGR